MKGLKPIRYAAKLPCARLPPDGRKILAELAEIHGMNEEKTDKYGAEIVELCKQAD